ncbi:MAG: hypothetical protein KatS3mg007_2204 [Thermoanaerobaculum sp.]|nr:MAG: hypothetical protein KatS3mg007_2204 [Thermoanaerobaculum sp.]
MSGYSATYGYDAKDERVAWTDSTEPGIHYTLRGLGSEILREVHELNGVWSWRKDYVFAGKDHIATITPTGLTHVHKDHLGSTRVVTSSTGAKVSEHRYWPFGEEMTVSSSPERMRFAGHERDANTSLDYMHARYYAPWGGRFLSVDPGRDYDFKSPQSFNLYAYVRNNPVSSVDPTGKEKTGFERELYEAFVKNSGNATPEQRAFEIAMGAGLFGLAALPAVAVIAPESMGSIAVGTAFGMASSTPVLFDQSMGPDAKVEAMVVSGAGGGFSGVLASPVNPTSSGFVGGTVSFFTRLASGGSVRDALGAGAVSLQGAFTGGLVARQFSYESIKSNAGLTAVASGIQAVFDALKALTDIQRAERQRRAGERPKAAVMVNSTTNPVTQQETQK